MDISNRALAMFLLAAIVVTLGGTIVSLNKLDAVSTTGFATTDTGNVSVTVGSTTSITLDNNFDYNFGTCTPSTSVLTHVNTHNTENSSICTGSDGNQPLYVRNDGNVDVNVTINASQVGEAQGGNFLDLGGSGTSAIYFNSSNQGGASPGAAGCSGTTQASWQVFATTNTMYLVCSTLDAAGVSSGANTVAVDIRLAIPISAPGESDSVDFEFRATAV